MRTATEPHRVSVTMALDALREQAETVDEALANYKRQLAIRDDLIRDCREAKIPERALVKLTGLSRDSIHRIANSPRRTYQ